MKKLLFTIAAIFLYIGVSAQIQEVNVGVAPNDGTGDNLRAAFEKVNNNDDYLDGRVTSVEAVVDYVTIEGDSTFLGVQSGQGYRSCGFGYQTLRFNTGDQSNGFGAFAGESNAGIQSNGFGYNAISHNTGEYSNGFGHASAQYNTGRRSNGFGFTAMQNNTGANCDGFGYNTMGENKGANSGGFGYAALTWNTGANTYGFGYFMARLNNGDDVVGLGFEAMTYNDGRRNTGIGSESFNSFSEDNASEQTFAGTAIITSGDTIFISSHGFTGDYINLKWTATTGSFPSGITLNQINQFKIVSADTLKLMDDGMSSQGSGNHTLTPQFIYENSTALGYNSEPTASNQVMVGNATTTSVKTNGVINQTQLSYALTDGSPTDAEIDAATGTVPGTAGAGYRVVIKDSDGTGLLYLIECDGTDWYYSAMVKAI